jgi:hypothetical protein
MASATTTRIGHPHDLVGDPVRLVLQRIIDLTDLELGLYRARQP